MSEKVLKIGNFFGKEIEVIPKLFLYQVSDFMGKRMTIPGIQLYTMDDGEPMPFATLTKSFGEFIGLKNSAYIDTNNYSFAPQLLSLGVAKETGLTKKSGFCSYPLWVFEEEFLKEIGGADYERYSREFDDYMGVCEEGDESDE